MRYIQGILLALAINCISLQVLQSQTGIKNIKSDRLFFSIAYYHLFENNISGSMLDKLNRASHGFGDKGLARDMVLKQLIFSEQNTDIIDSLYKYKDHPDLRDLPALSDEPMERPTMLFNFFMINEMLKFSTDNFFENGLHVIPILESKISMESDEYRDEESDKDVPISESFETDGIAQDLKDYIDAIKWAVKSPPGLGFFIAYVSEEWESYRKVQKTASMADLYNYKLDQAIKMYPIIEYYISMPLDECLREYGKHNSVIPSANEVAKDPQGFINTTFQKLLKRLPTSYEISHLLPLFKADIPAEPGMLYYLIMSSEDYLYY